MKNIRFIVFALVSLFLGSFVFTACQQEESQPAAAEFGDAASALQSARKVEFIVSKFYSQE